MCSHMFDLEMKENERIDRLLTFLWDITYTHAYIGYRRVTNEENT